VIKKTCREQIDDLAGGVDDLKWAIIAQENLIRELCRATCGLLKTGGPVAHGHTYDYDYWVAEVRKALAAAGIKEK
jgi:hypothetical protein